jgi:hypothetical protein
MILGWLDRLLDKISFLVCDRSRGCGQAGFPKRFILSLQNSLMASSCGSERKSTLFDECSEEFVLFRSCFTT